MRERMELFFSRMETMIPGTWQGLEKGRGKIKLDSTGEIKKGRVNKGAKSAKIGEKCWWNGSRIYLVPAVRRKKEEIRRRENQSIKPKIVGGKASDEEINEPPITVMATRGNKWDSTFRNPYQSYRLSTPSGEITLDVSFAIDTLDLAWDEFKSGNFWLTTYPAPKDYTGFQLDAPIQHKGDVASSWTDNTFIVPYIHRYQVDPEKILEVSFSFSLGQDTGANPDNAIVWSKWSEPVRYIYRGERIENFAVMTPSPLSNGFCGSARNSNTAILLNSQPADKVRFKVGDVVSIAPERACVANDTDPCYGGDSGWAPIEYVAYGDPSGGAAAIPGLDLTITNAPRTVQQDEYPYQSYAGWTVIEGTPTPSVSEGNPFGFGAQYGRLVASLTDQADGPSPSIEQLVSFWSKIDYRNATALTAKGGGWVVKDLSGNEPTSPPLNYGWHVDPVAIAGRWWYTSSRNGIFWAYDIQMLWEWKAGVTWEIAFKSRAANSNYRGWLGPGSEILDLYYGDNPPEIPGGVIDDPGKVYEPPLIIARFRINTTTRQVDHETFYWVPTENCIDGASLEQSDCYGYFEPDFGDVMLAHAYDDDPRIVDGLDFDTVSDYMYDDIRGWLWRVNQSNGVWSCFYWKRPDDVEVGTKDFYDWVDNAYETDPDGEYEFNGSDQETISSQLETEEGLSVELWPVLRATPTLNA